ncbi:MAG: response regulator [Burkholderiaceae bacterium]
MPLATERRRILLAEHDPINRQVIVRLLDLIGHEVHTAQTGREALQRWHVGGIDLLLVDMNLRDMEGLALARKLRLVEAAKGKARIPIVMLGGDPPKPDMARTGAGHYRPGDIDATLAKPVQIKQLQAALARCLKAAHAQPLAAAAAPRHNVETQVDFETLHRLVGTDPEVVREILLDYLNSAREQAAHLRSAYRRGDVRQVGALVHKLKSASLAVGALALGELCADMELPAQSDFGTAELEQARFDRVFDAAVSCIEDYLEKLKR